MCWCGMAKKDKRLFVFIIILSGFLAIISLTIISPFVHELGHYTFAKAFNESIIDKFYIKPLGPFQDNIAGRLEFKEDVCISLSKIELYIVSFGGLIFQLIFFLLLFFIFKFTKNNLYVHSPLLFIFFGNNVNTAYSWLRDVYELFYSCEKLSSIISYILVVLIFVPIILLLTYFTYKEFKLWFKSLQTYPKNTKNQHNPRDTHRKL